MRGAHLDKEADIVRGEAVSQHAFDVELDDLEVDQYLERLGEVRSCELKQLGLTGDTAE